MSSLYPEVHPSSNPLCIKAIITCRAEKSTEWRVGHLLSSRKWLFLAASGAIPLSMALAVQCIFFHTQYPWFLNISTASCSTWVPLASTATSLTSQICPLYHLEEILKGNSEIFLYLNTFSKCFTIPVSVTLSLEHPHYLQGMRDFIQCRPFTKSKGSTFGFSQSR